MVSDIFYNARGDGFLCQRFSPRPLIGLSLMPALRFNGVEQLRLLFDGVSLLPQFLAKSLHLGLLLHQIHNFSQGRFHLGFEFKIDGL